MKEWKKALVNRDVEQEKYNLLTTNIIASWNGSEQNFTRN